jgi:type VI secretion system protein ImpJ
MNSPQKVVWSEGTLLSPQHLQALDRFHEAHLATRLHAVAPRDWGVLELELDPAALGAGQVRLLRFAGVFPDGLPVAFDTPEVAPSPRDVSASFPAAVRSLDVYLAVPREREGVPSYADEGGPAESRYVMVSRQLADATSPDATAPIMVARPNAVLLLGDERRDDHETIKVAELQRKATGQLTLSDWYVPPALRIGVSPRLVGGVREVLARAIAKTRELAESRRHRAAASDVTAPDLARLLQLLVLNMHVPVLAHLAEDGDTSPRECYLQLVQLAGQLATFRGDESADLPKFQHGDLRATFQPLITRLLELLGEVAVQQYVSVPLDQREGGLFLARVQDERVLRGQLFLTVKSDQPEPMVIEQLPRLAKIASASEIHGLVQAAAPGLPLKVVHRPPPQLPVRPGVIYFALVTEGRFWQGILTGRNIALYLPPPFDPAKTKLEMLAIPTGPAATSTSTTRVP